MNRQRNELDCQGDQTIDSSASEARPRPTKRRVCFATLQGISARVFLLPLMEELDRRGYEVHLVTSPESAAEPDRLDDVGFLTTHRISLPQGIAPMADLLAVFRLRQHFRSFRYDVVHPHMSKCASLVLPAAHSTTGAIRLYTNHGMAFLSARGTKRWLLRRVEIRSCRMAERVYFVSQSNRAAAVSAGVLGEGRAAVIGSGSICGLDADRFAPTAERIAAGRAWRRRLGIAPSAFVVGYVGRPVAHKGFHGTLRTWVRNFGTEPAAHLLLVGVGPVQIAEVLGGEMPPNVSSVPWSDTVATLYAAMDIVVLPSLHEGLGYTLLEAGAARKAVVGSRIPGIVDAIEEGVTGFLVGPGNDRELAVAIRRLWCEPALRDRLGRAGECRVRTQFDRQTVCRAFGDEYDRVVLGGTAARTSRDQ